VQKEYTFINTHYKRAENLAGCMAQWYMFRRSRHERPFA